MTRTTAGLGDTELRVLGTIRLAVAGEPVRLGELERGFLAAASSRTCIGGASLEQWLWGDNSPSSAHNRIQALVSGLRRKAGAGIIVTEDTGYRLGTEVATDLDDWQEAVALARDHTSSPDPAERAGRLEQILAAIDGLPFRGAPETTAVETRRDRIDQERLQVVEAHLEARIEAGLFDGLVGELAALTAEHPFHEGLMAQYVLCLGATGQQQRALETFRSTRDRLIEELGVEPCTQLRDAHQRVLSGDVPRVAASTVPSAPPRENSGLSLPVPRTLPRAPAGFVGRLDSLAILEGIAHQSGEAPVVVSVTGLSGSGTSAFVAAAGARLRERFPDGSLYADCSAVGSDGGVQDVIGTFLRMLGILPEIIPDDPAARVGLFRSVMGERRVLVVLDNVDNLDGTASPRMRDLLPTAPGSMALIASRSSVDRLDPTARIRLGSLDDDEALTLLESFAGRQRLAREPDAAHDLVRCSGGLPLTLRLVGSRLADRPDLRVRALVSRLTQTSGGAVDLDPTASDSLQASLVIVWDRLPERTRQATRLLSLLPVDSFGAWVPTVLLDDPYEAEQAIDALIDASFVEPVLREDHLPQYRLHDVVARFARDNAAGLDRLTTTVTLARALLERLVHHHRDVPLQFIPVPPPPPGDRPRLQEEHDEPGLVLATELPMAHTCAMALAKDAPELAWRLLTVCENARQFTPDDHNWLTAIETISESFDSSDPDDRLGAAILTAARAWHVQDNLGQPAPALELARIARQELSAIEAGSHAAAAGLVCAYAALSLGDRETAEFELGLVDRHLTDSPDDILSGWSGIVRGELLNDYDELESCEAELTAARLRLESTGERIGYARACVYLARACARQGRLEHARTIADGAIDVLAEHRADRTLTMALDARAEISVGLREGPEAFAFADRALSRAEVSCDAFLVARSTRTRARSLALLGESDKAVIELRRAARLFEDLGRTLSVAATWRELATVQDDLGDTAGAQDSRSRQRDAARRAVIEDPQLAGVATGPTVDLA